MACWRDILSKKIDPIGEVGATASTSFSFPCLGCEPVTSAELQFINTLDFWKHKRQGAEAPWGRVIIKHSTALLPVFYNHQ